MGRKFQKGDKVVLIQGENNPTMIVTGYKKEFKPIQGRPFNQEEGDEDVEVTWNEGTTSKRGTFHQDLLKKAA